MTSCRHYSNGEEIANAVTHGVGALLAMVGLVVLVLASSETVSGLVASLVYGGSLVLLYAASTLYHALPGSASKRIWRTFDHAAIYLLIAGTYTPFAVVGLGDRTGLFLLVSVWCLAAVGIVITITALERARSLSIILYLVMGWLAVTVAGQLFDRLPLSTLVLMATGGLLYTGGLVFYSLRRPYLHAVWHLCVLGASALHFMAVLDTVTA